MKLQFEIDSIVGEVKASQGFDKIKKILLNKYPEGTAVGKKLTITYLKTGVKTEFYVTAYTGKQESKADAKGKTRKVSKAFYKLKSVTKLKKQNEKVSAIGDTDVFDAIMAL